MNWVSASNDLKPHGDTVVVGEFVVPASGGYSETKTIYASVRYDHLYKKWKLFGITDYAIEAMLDKKITDVIRWANPSGSNYYVVSKTGETMPTEMI